MFLIEKKVFPLSIKLFRLESKSEQKWSTHCQDIFLVEIVFSNRKTSFAEQKKSSCEMQKSVFVNCFYMDLLKTCKISLCIHIQEIQGIPPQNISMRVMSAILCFPTV